MSDKIDVLAVMEGLCEVADEHRDEGPIGYGWASYKLGKLRADGPEARAAVAELIAAASDPALFMVDLSASVSDAKFAAHDRLRAALDRVRSS